MMDVNHAIEDLLKTVLDDCVKHIGSGSHKALFENLQQGDEGTNRFFYRRLGQEIAQFLGTWDEDVKSVYQYDYANATEHLRFNTTISIVPIHLIVWTRRKTAALQALITVLDRGLVKGITVLCREGRIIHLLDAQMIDDADIHDQTGYGVLLFSLGLAPTRVWSRVEQLSEISGQADPASQLAAPLS